MSRGRGRPAIYTGKVAQKIVKLIKQTGGASQAREVLNARNGVVGITKAEQEAAALRAKLGFPKPVGISMPTLLKLAKNSGVELHRGRPGAEAA